MQILVILALEQIPAGMDKDLLAIDMQADPGSILMVDKDKRPFGIRNQLIITVSESKVIETELL